MLMDLLRSLLCPLYWRSTGDLLLERPDPPPDLYLPPLSNLQHASSNPREPKAKVGSLQHSSLKNGVSVWSSSPVMAENILIPTSGQYTFSICVRKKSYDTAFLVLRISKRFNK